MISSKDRSGLFGASDVSYIVGNWDTKTWRKWWLTKLGITSNNIETVAMNAGTNLEHKILESISPFIEMDKQIILPEIRLRVNFDGNIGKHIYECKTHSAEKPFKPSKKYIQQVIVQMYALQSNEADIVSYGLTDGDYKNYFRSIDQDRLQLHPISYDEIWINKVFLPRITYLAECLDKGIMPNQTI